MLDAFLVVSLGAHRRVRRVYCTYSNNIKSYRGLGATAGCCPIFAGCFPSMLRVSRGRFSPCNPMHFANFEAFYLWCVFLWLKLWRPGGNLTKSCGTASEFQCKPLESESKHPHVHAHVTKWRHHVCITQRGLLLLVCYIMGVGLGTQRQCWRHLLGTECVKQKPCCVVIFILFKLN